MPKKRRPPELTFQQHIADYLVREHKYGVLEQSEITDTEHYPLGCADCFLGQAASHEGLHGKSMHQKVFALDLPAPLLGVLFVCHFVL